MYGLEEGRIDPRAYRNPQGGVWDVSYGGGDNLPAKIYEREVINRHASDQAKEAVFEKKLYIRIQLPAVHATKKGDLIDVPLTEKHKIQYPEAWADFQNGSERVFSGTPLSTWVTPLLDEAKRIELAALQILTMEQVRDMPDGSIGALGQHGRWLKKAAEDELQRRWHEKQKAEAGSRSDELEAQNRALSERLAALEAKLGPKPAKASKKKGKDAVADEPQETTEDSDGLGE